MANNHQFTECDIIRLLAAKHSKDVFIPGCKSGPTWTGPKTHIFDAWAMRKSWTKPCVTIHEVKVSRSDFLQDQKWRDYLSYCNEFYFVAPPGIIEPNELAPEAGLIITSTNCARLYTKKKAAYRDCAVPESLYRYVLMNRTSISDEHYDRKAYWESWLVDKQINADFGHRVSRAISEVVNIEILAVRAENKRLAKEVEQYGKCVELLEGLGINIHSWNWREALRQKIVEKPPNEEIEKALDLLDRARSGIRQMWKPRP